MKTLDEQIKKAEQVLVEKCRAFSGELMSYADFCKAENEYVKAAAVVIALLEEKAGLRATPSCPTCKNYERKIEPTRYNCYDCAHFDPDKCCLPFLLKNHCHWEPKVEPEKETVACPKCGTKHPCMEELVDELCDVVNQATRMEDGTLDSMALSANASGMRLLARLGKLTIDNEHGRRVIAHWPEQANQTLCNNKQKARDE